MNLHSYPREKLIREASLTKQDMAELAQCRGNYSRLGFAYQMGFVRLHNRFPTQQPFEVHQELLGFSAIQLGIDSALIQDYGARQPTVSDHQARIRDYLGIRTFGLVEVRELEEFVFTEACRLERSGALLAGARQFLKERHIIFPADYALSRIIGEQRRLAREQIYHKVAEALPGETSRKLNALLEVKANEKVSDLQKLKANPGRSSAGAMQSLMEKLSLIEATGVLAMDLTWLNSNYQRALFHYVRKSSVHRLREVTQPRHHAALVCFLWQSYRDAVDQAVDMFDKLLTGLHTQAENELDQQMRDQRRKIRTSLTTLQALGEIILDDSIQDAQLRERIFKAIPREELAAQVDDLSEWVSGKNSDLFHGIVRRFGYLRRFSPTFLEALEFFQDSQEADIPCLEALKVLRELNADNKRTLPEDAPLDFIPKRLLPMIMEGGAPNKRAWECALLLRLRVEIKLGNISVKHSKRFGRFDDFFIPRQRWESVQEEFFRRSGLPANPQEVGGYLRERLNQAYDLFLKRAPTNSYATVDGEGWHLSVDASEKLDKDLQAQLERLKDWLSKQMRHIRLPDLLIEVDNELRFTDHFLPSAQRGERHPEHICTILAAVMAHGCNIGLYTMAQLTKDISYRQLRRVSDWQMTEETQRAALAELVQAISRLGASRNWGEGRTSASDGQRFSLPRKVLQQTYSMKFSDFALEFYSFVADNYAPFYSTPIECTDRDAAFVLDGLLYNESDLELEEHYTDTHGYTEINFAAFAMLGRRFCPRIRGLQDQRIYRIDSDGDYGALASLVSRADRTIDAQVITEQWDRMGQFYASLASGHTTASVALRRLAAYSPKNRFYCAHRELGRVFKTEFILHYMSEPQLRARIRRGLLKVEQLHALARDVYYGRRGRINARELHEQMNSCSCLTLILACIIYWQASEISRVLRCCDPEGNGIDVSLLEHISPIEWDNIILYGQYVIDPNLVR
jgi:TnpA family transposase